MFDKIPEIIYYCYSRWQDGFEDIKNENEALIFHEGIIDIDEISKEKVNLIILDDLMDKAQNDQSIKDLFTVDSHHKNISVFFLSQNIFDKGKHTRTISLNSHYMILFNNPRDRSQINYLSRQMYPNKSKYLIECFQDATENYGHGYLFLDFKQKSIHRIQTGILPNEKRIIYKLK